jgi:ABC-type nitrate/sulfonate/bicarbonate transport system ATPase subunit
MIRISNLYKSYGEHTVISDLSMSFSEGERVAFMAPSGCGKTTLLRVLSGLEKPDEGSVFLKEQAAFLFQEPRLLPEFTLLTNLTAVMEGKNKKERAAEALLKVGLSGEEKKYPHQLSGGMAQRAALARALVTGRRIFFLDEPFKGLDSETKRQILALCKEALADKTVLLVTHDEGEARALCDRVICFSKGMQIERILNL